MIVYVFYVHIFICGYKYIFSSFEEHVKQKACVKMADYVWLAWFAPYTGQIEEPSGGDGDDDDGGGPSDSCC